MTHLRNLVKSKVLELGDERAAEFFGVSKLLIQQWRNGSKPPSLAAVERVFELPLESPSLKSAEWEGKKVAILQPFYKSVHPVTHFSLLGLLERDKMRAIMEHNDAFIAHARNVLATRFLEAGPELAFYVDDDMVVPFGNATWFNKVTGFGLPEKYAGKHALNSLMAHGKSLVGMLYYGRNPNGRPMFYEALLKTPEAQALVDRLRRGPVDELFPTRWCATGALLVHRQVFLDIQKKFPNLAPQHPNEPWHFFTNANDAAVQRLESLSNTVGEAFQQTQAGKFDLGKLSDFLDDIRVQLAETKAEDFKNSRSQMGEDQVFGVRAGLAGHQSYVDLGLIAGHIGQACYGPFNTK